MWKKSQRRAEKKKKISGESFRHWAVLFMFADPSEKRKKEGAGRVLLSILHKKSVGQVKQKGLGLSATPGHSRSLLYLIILIV